VTISVQSLDLDALGTVELTVAEFGEGAPVLLLHGGGGPQTMLGYAELLAARVAARVIAPTHPGFAGTPRPDGLGSVGALARLYDALLEQLGMNDVVVVGNSLGGWIGAELAVLGSARIRGLVLVDAVGVDLPEHAVVDFFALPLERIADYSFHDSDRFRIDPSTMSTSQRDALSVNREALRHYGGSTMNDPTLRARLAGVVTPTLVVWGDADRIADTDYGRALAAAIPGARFVELADTGHLPQLESPDRLTDVVEEFVLALAPR
jgi:pimeloyl-ACP methyl ester carboxylesterase